MSLAFRPRPRTSASRALLACAVTGVLALAGCSSHAASQSTTASGITPAALDLLTRSGSYTSNEKALSLAESELIHSCMQALRFPYVVDTPAPPDLGVDLSQRGVQGYGLYAQYASSATHESTSSAATKAAKKTNDQYIRRLPEKQATAFMRALRGTTSDLRDIRMPGTTLTLSIRGCEPAARKRLYGSMVTYAQLRSVPQNLSATLDTRVQHDPGFSALMRKWSTCMTAAGYHYALPADAQDQLKAAYRKQGATAALRRREIAVATADGECALRLRIPTHVITIRKRLAATALTAQQQLAMNQLANEWLTAATTAKHEHVTAVQSSDAGGQGQG
ncbi:hypothetical protein [Actinacidiphila oryziradicis]|uniref:hypothetical protein n=1 Tax=Actinacidiphila oryziradicis TaxID=2571141 RepID=UPI0023F16787|nr:hypothetical protein [Actinacidiphila oryziradicis]MCW2870171.1 hypothetical protein [Actinacidiphila oryziradicis]